MNRHLAVLAFAALAAATSALAQSPAVPAKPTSPPAPTLTPGDPAPPLKVERFLKGDPITTFEEGKVYVVEFWATWCAPCIQAMPHLSALQARYKDRGVTIISTNIREMRRVGEGYADSFDAETRAKVESFVREHADRMAYTVAYDGATKSMDRAWMEASGSQGIPTAFIVDRAGTIAWFGHPMVLRMPLHEVAEGTWDQKTGPQRVKHAEDAYLAAMRLFTTDPKAGLTAWDRAAEDYPVLAPDLIGPKFQALHAAGHSDAANAAGEAWFVEAVKIGDAGALNTIAWSIVDPNAKPARRNLDLATRAAAKANDLTNGKDPSMLDTLARVHFSKGEIDKAVEIQLRAVELADEPLKSRLAPALDEYRKAR